MLRGSRAWGCGVCEESMGLLCPFLPIQNGEECFLQIAVLWMDIAGDVSAEREGGNLGLTPLFNCEERAL